MTLNLPPTAYRPAKPHIRRYFSGKRIGWVWGLYLTRDTDTPAIWACSFPALVNYLRMEAMYSRRKDPTARFAMEVAEGLVRNA